MLYLSFLLFITLAAAQLGNGIKVSFKRTTICETTSGVKAYSGYVYLPPNTLSVHQPYPINTFFWYFPSRNDPNEAPLSIWLNGGPGVSSMQGLFTENGPCTVNSDSTTTKINPWSWNAGANMLYIDQPTQTGFSYDTLANFTISRFESEKITPIGSKDDQPASNNTFFVGTLASQIQENTANTTEIAAEALWHTLQGWIGGFPHHHWKSSRRTKNTLSIWAQSYGGKMGPATAAYIKRQNEKIDNNRLDAVKLSLDTLGIVNGCIDDLVQAPGYIEMGTNNPYDITIFNAAAAQAMKDAFEGPGGVKEKMAECRRLAALQDSHGRGDVAAVNSACANAFYSHYDTFLGKYYATQKGNIYDVAMPYQDIVLPYYYGYLLQKEVLDDLGVPVNFTAGANAPYYASIATGDSIRAGRIADIEELLDSGVKVSFMYGDRDYICNWYGGEAVSLALKHKSASRFRKAGYADLMVGGKSYGKVRQHGNLSFTRLYQAGHSAPAYQPEAAYAMFIRSAKGVDTATGKTPITSGYSTTGPTDVRSVKLVPPTFTGKRLCYVLSPFTCLWEEWLGTVNGKTIVKDYIVLGFES